MANIIMNSHFYIQNTGVVLLLYLTSTITLSLSLVSSFGCVLDIHQSSTWNNSVCEPRNWGGLLNSCGCEPVFEDYLYALSQRANQTKKIFLNHTEQKECLLFMKSIDPYSPSCGFQQKLTGGVGGCADFSPEDVFDNLGDTLKTLEEDCKRVDSTGELGTKACSGCRRRWEAIVASPSNETGSEKDESTVCGFSALVTLTGIRASDKNWIQALYKCLGDQDSKIGEKCLLFFFFFFKGF